MKGRYDIEMLFLIIIESISAWLPIALLEPIFIVDWGGILIIFKHDKHFLRTLYYLLISFIKDEVGKVYGAKHVLLDLRVYYSRIFFKLCLIFLILLL